MMKQHFLPGERPTIGTRIEIPVHYDAWMQGARFGKVTAFRHGKPGQSDFVIVALDNRKKPLKLWAPDWPYASRLIELADYQRDAKQEFAKYGFTSCPLNDGELWDCYSASIAIENVYLIGSDVAAGFTYQDAKASNLEI